MKKGAVQHFEMVMSFVLFMSFVFFLFLTLKPFEYRILKDVSFGETFKSLSSKLQTKRECFYLKKIDKTQNPFFVKLNKDMFEGKNNYKKSIVKNMKNQVVPSFFDGKNDILYIDSADKEFYVCLSEEFDSNQRISGKKSDYTMGDVIEDDFFSEKKIMQLKARYENDYDKLKNEIGLAPIYDFSFSFVNPNYSVRRYIRPAAEVDAKSFFVKVLNKKGDVFFEMITIKVW